MVAVAGCVTFVYTAKGGEREIEDGEWRMVEDTEKS